jgi:predicted permease
MFSLRNWFRRPTLERGLERELRYHFDRRVEDFVASGLSEAEARRRAAIDLGGMTQVREEVRDVWLTRWLRDFLYDLRFSLRGFRRNPSFTATAVFSLALGIGATTAIYSLVDQVLLHALPVREPGQLVMVDWQGEQIHPAFGSYNLLPYPLCRDLERQDRFFDGVLCRAATTVNLATSGDPRPAAVELVSGSYFATLGVRPSLGRLLGPDDDRAPLSAPVVVLSHDFWQTQFAGSHDVIGRKVLINRNPMTIVGVAAAGFRGVDVGEIPTLWIPAVMSEQALPGFKDLLGSTRWMQVLARLKPGITSREAQAGLAPWFKSRLLDHLQQPGSPRITEERRQRHLASVLELTPAPQGHSVLRRRLGTSLWVVLAATGVLLTLACLNVAGLFLARGSARHREIGTRLALGASRGRIGRQLLADSLILSVAGGILGLLLAPFATRALITFLPRETAANALEASIDMRLLLFAFAMSFVAGVLTSLAPAWQAGRDSLISSLRERSSSVFGGARLRKAIVTFQIAFTLVLVIGAALFVRTLSGLMTQGPGFTTTSLISFGISPGRSGYTPADASRLVRRIHHEIRASPASQAAAAASFQLLTGGSWNNPMTIQSSERIVTDRSVNLNTVTPGFFPTLGARIVAGRDFNERDAEPGSRVTIVNGGFAKRYFAGKNPLGARIAIGSGPDVQPNIEIVGVVADIRYRGIREEAEQAYFPAAASEAPGNFYVRIRGNGEEAARAMREIIRRADPTLPITYFRTLDEQVSRSLNTERLLATLSGSFGTLALVLSLIGLYGVMSFVVTQRTREIGIRLALGAGRGSALWLVLREALVMVAAGIALALPAVWALGALIEAQLYGVKPTDPAAIAAATLVLSAAALGAALIPARRASAMNPADTLRLD